MRTHLTITLSEIDICTVANSYITIIVNICSIINILQTCVINRFLKAGVATQLHTEYEDEDEEN